MAEVILWLVLNAPPPRQAPSNGGEVDFWFVPKVFACIALFALFFIWCAWRGRLDGEEHGPRM